MTADDEDIVACEGTGSGGFSIFFGGSDVGLGSLEIDGFDVISPTEILMSFTGSTSLPGAGSVDDSDT